MLTFVGGELLAGDDVLVIRFRIREDLGVGEYGGALDS